MEHTALAESNCLRPEHLQRANQTRLVSTLSGKVIAVVVRYFRDLPGFWSASGRDRMPHTALQSSACLFQIWGLDGNSWLWPGSLTEKRENPSSQSLRLRVPPTALREASPSRSVVESSPHSFSMWSTVSDRGSETLICGRIASTQPA